MKHNFGIYNLNMNKNITNINNEIYCIRNNNYNTFRGAIRFIYNNYNTNYNEECKNK